MNGLVSLNLGTLSHIKEVAKAGSRLGAATKLGIPIDVVEKVSSMDHFQMSECANDYAEHGVLITCSNLVVGKPAEAASLAIDKFFKVSLVAR